MKYVRKHLDPWQASTPEWTPAETALPHRVLSLEQWHSVREHWPHDIAVGVTVDNTADVENLAKDLDRIALICLQFPRWTDGRAYSQGYLLRRRLGFTGELRATGDILIDMLPQLERCGFDAVILRSEQDEAAADRALSFFHQHYQGDALGSTPHFLRRSAA
jgi:uncharacterized protein (DUF934 family)